MWPWVVVGAVAVAALVAAGFIVGFIHFNVWKPWVSFSSAWGLSALNLSVSLMFAWLVVVPHSLLARLLSLGPLIWIGRRAYGIYLVHPLVLAIVATKMSLRRLPFEAVVVTGTFVTAGLSFLFFETSFLRLTGRFSSR